LSQFFIKWKLQELMLELVKKIVFYK
jgi:hypothetical protein